MFNSSINALKDSINIMAESNNIDKLHTIDESLYFSKCVDYLNIKNKKYMNHCEPFKICIV